MLLRILSTILGLVDGLFSVHWGERVLDRLANRWQERLAQLDRALSALEEERRQLHAQAEALAIHAAAIYLGGRSLARGELRFDPEDSHDEEILDATIELLVKERLAAIEPEEVEKDHYLYHLELDWVAIRARLARAVDHAPPDAAEWLRDSLAFIDESFLSGQGV